MSRSYRFLDLFFSFRELSEVASLGSGTYSAAALSNSFIFSNPPDSVKSPSTNSWKSAWSSCHA